MSIGYGQLPAPADAPPGTKAWIVPGVSVADATHYYDLHDNEGTPIWLEQTSRLLRGDDPVLLADGTPSLLIDIADSAGASDRARLDDIESRAELRWRVGHTNAYCWTENGTGARRSWVAAAGTTDEQRGTTYPGAGTVWLTLQHETDTDAVAAYESARRP